MLRIDRSLTPGNRRRERSARPSATTQRGAKGRICRICRMCSAAESGRNQIKAAPATRRRARPQRRLCLGGPADAHRASTHSRAPRSTRIISRRVKPQPSHSASVSEQTSWPFVSNPWPLRAMAWTGGRRRSGGRCSRWGLRWLRVSAPDLIYKTCLSACKLGPPEPGGSAWVSAAPVPRVDTRLKAARVSSTRVWGLLPRRLAVW
jgi:hypothetical protein